DRQPATEDSAYQVLRQIGEAKPSAVLQKLEIAVGRMLAAPLVFQIALARESRSDVYVRLREPRRVEQREVVRVNACAIALGKRVTAEKHCVRTAVLELPHPVNDSGEGLTVAPIRVDRVQAGGPARRFVRLGKRFDRKTKRRRPGRRSVEAPGIVTAIAQCDVPANLQNGSRLACPASYCRTRRKIMRQAPTSILTHSNAGESGRPLKSLYASVRRPRSPTGRDERLLNDRPTGNRAPSVPLK